MAFLLGQKHFNYQLRGQRSHKTGQLSHLIRPKAITRQDSISQGTKHGELSLVQREQKAQAFSTRGPGAGTAGRGWRGSTPFWSFSWNKSAHFGESSKTKPGWLIPFQKGKPNYILCISNTTRIGRCFSCFLERGKKVQPHYCRSCVKLAHIISHHLKTTLLFSVLSTFYRWESWSSKKLATCPMSGDQEVAWMQSSLIPDLVFLSLQCRGFQNQA